MRTVACLGSDQQQMHCILVNLGCGSSHSESVALTPHQMQTSDSRCGTANTQGPTESSRFKLKCFSYSQLLNIRVELLGKEFCLRIADQHVAHHLTQMSTFSFIRSLRYRSHIYFRQEKNRKIILSSNQN